MYMNREILSAFKNVDEKNRITNTQRRRFMALIGGAAIAGMAGCSALDDNNDEDENNGGEIGNGSESNRVNVQFTVPTAVNENGDPVGSETTALADVNSVMSAIAMTGSAMRGSEMSHENYNPALGEERVGDRGTVEPHRDMRDVGDHLVHAFEVLNDGFLRQDNSLAPELVGGDDWERSDENARLEDHARTAYAYHPHHRGIGRWGRMGHGEHNWEITFTSAGYISATAEYALDNRYNDGEFQDNDGNITHESMCYGLGAINGAFYAWVRRNCPDGMGDADVAGSRGGNMGVVTRNTLEGYIGYDEEELGEIAEEIANVYDEYWDPDVGAYNFGDGTEYTLFELGALLRGHKGVYEFLHIDEHEERSGNDEGPWPYPNKPVDQDTAEAYAERTATMLEAIFEADIAEPYGIPASIEFTENGVESTSQTVDVAEQWKFINEIAGGWTLGRERTGEDSPQLLQENHPEVWNDMNEFTDTLLAGAAVAGHHLQEDNEFEMIDQRVISELDYETGEITDETITARALGNYITATENLYRGSGDDVLERARDWPDVSEDTKTASEEFYDIWLDLYDFLIEYFAQGMSLKNPDPVV